MSGDMASGDMASGDMASNDMTSGDMTSGDMTSDDMMSSAADGHGYGYDFDPYKDLDLPSHYGHGNDAFKKDEDVADADT